MRRYMNIEKESSLKMNTVLQGETEGTRIHQGSDDRETVPIPQKLALTIREAAEYSNIGINRIDQLLRAPHCPFVLYVGTKKLVKRKVFEEFIHSTIVI